MALLAAPLQLALGAENNETGFVEEFVVAAPQGVAWTAVDSRIAGVREASAACLLVGASSTPPTPPALHSLPSLDPLTGGGAGLAGPLGLHSADLQANDAGTHARSAA